MRAPAAEGTFPKPLTAASRVLTGPGAAPYERLQAHRLQGIPVQELHRAPPSALRRASGQAGAELMERSCARRDLGLLAANG